MIQVQQVQADASNLIVAYSGPNAREIQEREMQVVNAWRSLQIYVEGRRNKLSDSFDLFMFFNSVRALLAWMSDICQQMAEIPKAK